MSMETSKIRDIVSLAKSLIKGEGNATDLMSKMLSDMTKSQTFAVAIITHLKEEGINLIAMEGEVASLFLAKFQPQIEKLSEREFTQIRKISEKLFN